VRLVGRLTIRTVAAAVVALAGCAVAGTASAATAAPEATASGTGFSVTGTLSAVAATSAGNAWAVGSTARNALIVHWNGKSWSEQADPAGEALSAVAASSAGNAWAVGYTSGSSQHTLTLHWNGKKWTRVPSPGPAGGFLNGVTTTSAGNAWAVGEYGDGNSLQSLILHWNGKKWTRVSVPKVTTAANQGSFLDSVSAASASSVWASGSITSDFAGPQGGLLLHWNGRSWSKVSASALAAASTIGAVAAPAANSAWTMGCACAGGADGAPISHWNGKKWTSVREPFGAAGGAGETIAAAGGNAWAAGLYCKSHCIAGALGSAEFLMRWTGKAWQLTSHPAIQVTGLAVTSAGNAWAVGMSTAGKTVILHWNGKAWK
jgi:hypothetical protein